MLTLVELADRLKHQDEVSLLETLQITADDLVNRFMDRIEEKYDELLEELDDFDDEDC